MPRRDCCGEGRGGWSALVYVFSIGGGVPEIRNESSALATTPPPM